MTRSPWLLPAILLVSTIVVLIGCIPLPSSQQLQLDNTLRPEYFIGNGKEKPVRLGYTHFADAYLFLTQHARSYLVRDPSGYAPGGDVQKDKPLNAMSRWRFSEDHRQAWMRFETRSGFVVMPLCFSIRPESKEHWLVLDLDDRQIVTSAQTVEGVTPPPIALLDYEEIFDEPTRQKLAKAGVWEREDSPYVQFLRRQKKLSATTRSTTR